MPNQKVFWQRLIYRVKDFKKFLINLWQIYGKIFGKLLLKLVATKFFRKIFLEIFLKIF